MINHDVVKGIKDSVGTLLSNYAKEIEFAMADEGAVAISLPVKIKQDGPKLNIEVGISFVKEKVKDAVGFTIDGQMEMFNDSIENRILAKVVDITGDSAANDSESPTMKKSDNRWGD